MDYLINILVGMNINTRPEILISSLYLAFLYSRPRSRVPPCRPSLAHRAAGRLPWADAVDK